MSGGLPGVMEGASIGDTIDKDKNRTVYKEVYIVGKKEETVIDMDETADGLQQLFMKAAHVYFSKLFQQLPHTEVHPGQIPMLKLLDYHRELSQRQIAEHLNIKASTVTVSVQRMEKTGLIKRRPHERDQRVSLIFLTEKGRRLNARMTEIAIANEKIMFKDFTDSECCLLRRFLTQIIGNLEQLPGREAFDSWEENHTK